MSKLSADAIRLLSEGKNLAIIATIMPDGSPQATAVWVDTDGEHVRFNTSEGRVKTNNLRRDPRVAVAILNAENPYEQVTIRGRVVEFAHEGAIEHINSLARKYVGTDEFEGLDPNDQRVIVKIAPSHNVPYPISLLPRWGKVRMKVKSTATVPYYVHLVRQYR